MSLTLLFTLALALTVGLVIVLVAEVLPARERSVKRRLADIQSIGADMLAAEKRRRLIQSERVIAFLEEVGSRLQPGRDGAASDREMLLHAGYRSPSAAAVYWGARLTVGMGLMAAGFTLLPPLGWPSRVVVFAAVYFGAMGYILPFLYVRSKRRARQKELQFALADTLDLLVVCVEAGLGLNQALVRVAEEIHHVSPTMSLELLHTNAEIRAGTPRDQALRQLADRTGLPDILSLVTMLIQTDRFGTSIGRSLRVHSDTLRQKRRQRAEEAAAKTAIKMVFPLVFCIFPAMFVVILGPGMIQIFRTLGGLT